MLDIPAGIVPVGHVSKEDIANLKNFQTNGDFLLKKQKETCLGSEGLPIAIQVVTLMQQEELCIYVMKAVEEKMIGKVERLKWVEEEQMERFRRTPLKTMGLKEGVDIWTNEEGSVKLNFEDNTVHWGQKALKVGFVNEGYSGSGLSTPQTESTSASPRKHIGRAQSLCRIEF